ncbi:MAG: tetratricopeptide repeat protein [Acidobacteriia bacterium]|nr:tetratricopeptide repeat protein [Terriglobia bacterium]
MRKTRPKPAPREKPGATRQDVPKPARTSGLWTSRPDVWICLALLVATFAVYAQVRQFDFVNFDDPEYVGANPHVRHGITLPAIVWAFTSGEAANWFPVTRLSHILDCQFFGLQSGWHHLTNVLFHALATVLLFVFLRRATDARWPSAWVAFLFELHPLHVESVAWIAERKDVLSAFFWFLALWAYVRYAERPTAGRYLLVLLPFGLGLMAKPMIVTLPFVLLLLDIWPLRRAPFSGLPLSQAQLLWKKLLWEKLPFFTLSSAVAVITYQVQSSAGAVEALNVPLATRAGNALVSYIVYIAKVLWPDRLAVFYPYPPDLPVWKPVLAGLLILAITALVLGSLRGYPYLAVGWLWYLGTLLPVIGLVQVGAQARADRYTYVPMIGLSIMLAWGAADLVRRWPRRKAGVIALAAATCVSCVPLTWAQIEHWKNSETLFQHALEVTTGNDVAHHNLGVALSTVPGRLPEAISHYQAALRIKPNSARTHTDLGSALAKIPGRLPEAIGEFKAALEISPDSAIPHNDLGNALSKIPGRLPQAISEYETALRLNPDYPEAHNNLGSAMAKTGRLPEAIAQFEAALRLEPDDAEAHTNLGSALANLPGRLADAIAEYRAALRVEPNSAEAHNDLGSALAQTPDRLPDAIAEYEAALRLKPDYGEAHQNLGSALVEIPARVPEAISEYEAALRIDPNSAETHYNFGVALSKIDGRAQDAIAQFEAALRINPDYPAAHSNLGVALSNIAGRLPEAISHFEAALRLRPDYADAHYNLGVALSNIPGRMPQAISQFEEALRLKPDPQLRQLVERLRAGQH